MIGKGKGKEAAGRQYGRVCGKSNLVTPRLRMPDHKIATIPNPRGCYEFDPQTPRDHHIYLIQLNRISKPQVSSDQNQGYLQRGVCVETRPVQANR